MKDCLHLTVTLGLNIPPLIFLGLAVYNYEQALANGNNGCFFSLKWLSINAFLCIVNMAAAMKYICGSGKAVHPTLNDADVGNDAPFVAATMESSNNKISNEQQLQQLSSTIQKFWHDWQYVIIGFCFTVWQIVGLDKMNNAVRCGEPITVAVICGLVFISFVAVTSSCNVCCSRGLPWR